MADSMPVKANFTQFINGFAVQTLVHLGKMSNPMTGKAGVDLANAKYSIDILGILEEKTKGNLTSEEEEYLSNLLRDLRMEYVTVMNEKPGEAGESTENESKDEASS
ncbi:MAG: DUF1844 domain-containing protein [Planctomycetaceae bacterium]|nr:DUF1844 domain-containing protein [Planctomycetaceae bacterium]